MSDFALPAAGFPDGSFDKVFAINVNLFWAKDVSREIGLIKRMLSPEGIVFRFYEPPAAEQLPNIAHTLAAALEGGGFTVSTRTATRGAKSLIAPSVEPPDALRGSS
ncbi:MAG: methyltransferase domain-containing protein [Candidatus Limnocylindria bacterium]